jgi:hypothetical protein
MNDTPGRRPTKLGDPAGERAADPVPDGEDVLDRENPRVADTPRRYDEESADEPVMPAGDSTLKTQI